MKAKNPNAPALVVRTIAAGCGLIGVRAGKNVKYPSAIYWSGLRTYGVLRSDKAPDSLSALVTRGRTIESYELAVRAVSHSGARDPASPEWFPRRAAEWLLDLTADEATWLKERILAAVPGTLLAELLTAHRAPTRTATHPGGTRSPGT